MEPLSTTASIVAVLQLITKLTSYGNTIQNASKDQQKLLVETSNLYSVLMSLKFLIEEVESTGNNEPWLSQIRQLGANGGILEQFKMNLEQIKAKLDVVENRNCVKQALTWKFSKEELVECLDRIERLKTVVNFALAKDHFALSQSIHSKTSDIQKDVQKLRITNQEALPTKFTSWLEVPDMSSNYNAALEKRQEGTGTWWTQSADYSEWKKTPGKPMWLHGIPGCGKTILTTTALENLRLDMECSSKSKIGYFYFDFSDINKTSVEKLTRALLLQLLTQTQGNVERLKPLEDIWDKCNHGLLQPGRQEIETLLHETIHDEHNTYVVIDALDECVDREKLLDFIQQLQDKHKENLHLLLSSRQEQVIIENLSATVHFVVDLKASLVDADIACYVKTRLENDRRLKRWPISVRKEIELDLSSKSHGMFRWVYCQLELLRKCLSINKIKETLRTLPESLDDTYIRILDNIKNEGYIQEAILILQFLCYSFDRMRVSELLEVLAIGLNPAEISLESNQLIGPEAIASICSSLLAPINSLQENSVVQLAHYSVKEFLTSERNPYADYFSTNAGHTELTRVCLLCVLDLCTVSTSSREMRLLGYSAGYWYEHAQFIEGDKVPTDLIEKAGLLLDWYVFRWVKISDPMSSFRIAVNDDRYWDWNPRSRGVKSLQNTKPAICYVALIGSPWLVEALVRRKHNINTDSEHGLSALCIASYSGNKDMVKTLLDAGADVDAFNNESGFALLTAVWMGHKDIVRLLLESGADPNISSKGIPTQELARHPLYRRARGFPPILHAAIRHGGKTILNLLIEKGADVNAIDPIVASSRIVFETRPLGGRPEDLDLFFRPDYKGERFRSALEAACSRGHEELAQVLLEHGSDLVKFGNAALKLACQNGLFAIVQTLIERGVKVDIAQSYVHWDVDSSEYCCALQAACVEGHTNIVQLLLERGAKANAAHPPARQSEYCRVLEAACGEGYTEIVRLLLEHGADANIEGCCPRRYRYVTNCYHEYIVFKRLAWPFPNVSLTAFQIACLNGNTEMVQMLLDHGAQVNDVFVRGKDLGWHLRKASRSFGDQLTQMLKDAGALWL